MADRDRLDRIVGLVEERGFLTVRELSVLLDVSEMTIRRDLAKLERLHRLKKTYGGAASIRATSPEEEPEPLNGQKPDGPLVDTIDVLIATLVNPLYDSLLLDRAQKRKIPVIAESVELPDAPAQESPEPVPGAWGRDSGVRLCHP